MSWLFVSPSRGRGSSVVPWSSAGCPQVCLYALWAFASLDVVIAGTLDITGNGLACNSRSSAPRSGCGAPDHPTSPRPATSWHWRISAIISPCTRRTLTVLIVVGFGHGLVALPERRRHHLQW